MTPGTVVGAVLVFFGALVLALSVAALARANPTGALRRSRISVAADAGPESAYLGYVRAVVSTTTTTR